VLLSNRIELDIFKFMSKSTSAAKCVERHLPLWRSLGLSFSDINIISHFLYSNNEFAAVIRVNLDSIEREEPVSWQYLGKSLKMFEPNLDAPVYEALQAYISNQKKLDEFCTSDLFEPLFPAEGEFKILQIQKKAQINERHRQTLLDQIRVFHQSRNYKVEKQTIQKFMKFYPNDKQGQSLFDSYENADLDRFFHIYMNERRPTQRKPLMRFTDDERELLDRYFEQIRTSLAPVSTEEPFSPAEDLHGYVYFFLFLEDYTHALKLWPRMQDGPSKDWLKLDILLSDRKFAEALSYFKELDHKYQQEPAYYSAKIYYVAQCFWGLGDHRKAVELMENLIQIKPDYRLAATFLRDWRQET
jgi:tetratricopeptide (TPR) repeat protein